MKPKAASNQVKQQELIQTKTFVFLDLVPDYDNPTKIVALNLLTAPRSHFLENVYDKTKLQPEDMQTLNLRDESDFNKEVINLINAFINRQTPPVCLLSHNGNRFDFPILKHKCDSVNVSLSDDVMCADSCFAFYDVQELRPELYGNAVRVEFYDGKAKPKASYKLWDVYRKFVPNEGLEQYKRENDNKAAFTISMYLGQKFLNWVEQKQRSFGLVQPTDLLYTQV